MSPLTSAQTIVEAISNAQVGVIPVVVGPIQILIAIAPGLLAALLGWFLAVFKPQSLKIGAKLLWRFKIQVVLIAAAGWGLNWTWQLYAPVWFPESAGSTAQVAAGSDWIAFRGGPSRSGWQSTAEAAARDPLLRGPNRPGNAWTWKRANWQVLASPAIVGDLAYFPTVTITPYDQDGSGRLVCLDLKTGEPRWIWDGAALDGYRATFSSPAIAGKFLVIGEGLHFCKNARIYCFDISGPTPKKLWSYRTKDHVESSPAIQLNPDGQDGSLVVGAGVDGYYCFDLVQKNPAEPKPRWHTYGGRGKQRTNAAVSIDAESSPLIHNGRVYVGNGNGMWVDGVFKAGEAVQCLDLKTGAQVWKLDTGLPTFGPSTIVGDHLYVGMGNGDFINDAAFVREEKLKKDRAHGLSGEALARREAQLAAAGAVWKIRLTNQGKADERAEKVGEFRTTVAILSAVAHSDGRLVFSDTSGMVYATDTDLKEKARWNAGAKLMTSCAVTSDTVYCVPTSGLLYALDADTLRPQWESFIGTGGLFVGSPAVAHNRVFVPSGDHGVQAIGMYSAVPPPALWPGERGQPSGAADGAALPATGNFLWNWPKDQDADTPNATRVSAAVAIAHDSVLIPIASGSHAGLVAIAHDRTASATPVTRWRFAHPLGVASSPVVVDTLALVLTGKPGDAGRELLAISATGAAAGSVAWKRPISGSAALSADLHGVIAAVDARRLTALSATGAVQWEYATADEVLGSQIAGTVVLATTTREVLCLSRRTGGVLWRVALAARSAPALSGTVALCATPTGVTALNIGDGAAIAGWPTFGAGAAFAVDGHGAHALLAQVTAVGELVVTRMARQSADQDPVLLCAPALASAAPILVRGMVLWVDANGSWKSSQLIADGAIVAKPKISEWCDGSWLGLPTTPPISAATGVYVGMGPWGLVRLGGGK